MLENLRNRSASLSIQENKKNLNIHKGVSKAGQYMFTFVVHTHIHWSNYGVHNTYTLNKNAKLCYSLA